MKKEEREREIQNFENDERERERERTVGKVGESAHARERFFLLYSSFVCLLGCRGDCCDGSG